MRQGPQERRCNENERTSGSRNTTSKRNERGDIFTEEGSHGFHKIPSDTRVTANKRVDANCNGGANPGFRHAKRSYWVAERKNVGVGGSGGEDSSMLMLKECFTQNEMLVRPSIGWRLGRRKPKTSIRPRPTAPERCTYHYRQSQLRYHRRTCQPRVYCP